MRLPASLYQWVKDRPELEFSSLLYAKVRELQKAEEERTREEAVQAVVRTEDVRVAALRGWIADRNRRGQLTSQKEIDAKRAELGL